MTLAKLNDICKRNNISEDVNLLSDSGWECCETKMDGVYYNKKHNTIIFKQNDEGNEITEGGRFDSPIPKDTIFIKVV